jgi:hypothetical protein
MVRRGTFPRTFARSVRMAWPLERSGETQEPTVRFVTSYLVIGVGVLTARWSALAAAAPSQDELSTIAIFREMSRGVVHVTAMSARQAEPDGEGGARRRWYRLCFFDHAGHH